MAAEQSFSDELHNFTQETTMHGIRYVKMKGISIIRRILWTVIILSMLVYFSYAGFNFFDGYLKKKVSTKIKVKTTDELQFPAVTICNRNYWKKSAVEHAESLPPEIVELFKEMLRDVYVPQSQLPPPVGKYNWSDPLLQVYTYEGHDVETQLKMMAPTLNETFKACYVNSASLPCQDLLVQVKTDAGICYQFNGDGKFYSHASGLSGGVQFVMDTLTHEYYIGPFSYSEGFSIAIHEPGEIPLVSELSYGLKTGAETIMTLHKKITQRQPPPADDNQADCFDSENLPNPLHYYSTYSYSACYYECQISYVLNQCGCVDFLHPPLNGSSICAIDRVLVCAALAKREFLADSKHLKGCDCTSACNEVQYTAKVSSYTFPSDTFVEEKKGYFNMTGDYMRKNFVGVTIYYNHMSYELLEETITYSILDMFASVGGTIGVATGASLLTLVEILEFIMMSVARVVSRRFDNRTPVKPFKNTVEGIQTEKPQLTADQAIEDNTDNWAREKFKSYDNLRLT